MKTRYPIYIVSKGRWQSRLTSKALEVMHIPYFIVVEASEWPRYAEVIDPRKILILPQVYLDQYDTCDDFGATKSKGPGAARNFCWDHSIAAGHARHWVMDDNLDAFHRLYRNTKWESDTGAVFLAQEDFVDRYTNVAIAGPNYYSFVKSTDAVPAYVLNTRIYSCLLIKNDIPYRWRGRYNEDTDLSLRVLKDGWVTVQFNAFLCGKVTTQRMSGGNTKEFYSDEGTKPKSQMLEDLHPDVAKVVWRFNRWHHHVDYRPFKDNALVRRADVVVPEGINNYGMRAVMPTNYERNTMRTPLTDDQYSELVRTLELMRGMYRDYGGQPQQLLRDLYESQAVSPWCMVYLIQWFSIVGQDSAHIPHMVAELCKERVSATRL